MRPPSTWSHRDLLAASPAPAARIVNPDLEKLFQRHTAEPASARPGQEKSP